MTNKIQKSDHYKTDCTNRNEGRKLPTNCQSNLEMNSVVSLMFDVDDDRLDIAVEE